MSFKYENMGIRKSEQLFAKKIKNKKILIISLMVLIKKILKNSNKANNYFSLIQKNIISIFI